MTILVIVLSVAGLLAAVTGFIGWVKDSAVWGIVCGCFVFAAIILGMVTGVVAQDNYNEETNRICAEKGGVVTKDNHCFVDNKPVEFSPDVWQR